MKRSAISCYGTPALFERHDQGNFVPRHRHYCGYVTVVLSGNYEEHGDEGRFAIGPGQVICHRAFEAHQNIIAPKGARMMSFKVADGAELLTCGAINDPDEIARVSERDPVEALGLLAQRLQPGELAGRGDWPDELARWLSSGSRGRLADWSANHGLTREAAARGFKRAFGIDPRRFRLEAMARTAWNAITSTDRRLCDIALDQGFCDQAHLTRAVVALTGHTPGAWRRSQSFKTDGLRR